jgi:hypothetical protein
MMQTEIRDTENTERGHGGHGESWVFRVQTGKFIVNRRVRDNAPYLQT